MNTTIYLFGNFGHGLVASVNDYTKTYFDNFISKISAPTQIIIHRNGDIMNYGYVRRITGGHLFGICAQINGQYLSTTNKLFEVFENIVANIAVRGDILFLNKNGDLEPAISSFLDNTEVVERVINNCQNEFLQLSSSCLNLPDPDFSTTNADISYFNENDDINIIVRTSIKNGYTYIYKKKDYDTLALNGYRNTLATLNKENESYKQTIRELESKLKSLEKKKKQMGVVVALLMIMFVGFVIFFTTIEEKNYDIMVKNQTIVEQEAVNNTLTEKNIEILKEKTDLVNRNNNLVIKQDSTNQELENLSAKFKHLNERYIKLQQESSSYYTQYIREINSLKKSNEALEQKINQNAIDMASKTADYKILQNKYDRISKQLNTIEKKYYSTREGKKELSR